MKTYLDRTLAVKILEKALELSKQELTNYVSAVASAFKVEESVVERLLRKATDRFGSSNRVAVGLAAVEYGADIQRIARTLTWREMEEFAAEAATASGLRSLKNLYLKLKNRRIQIDLIAYTPTHCIIFDCKRWSKRLAGKTLEQVVLRARNRTLYVAEWLAEKKPGTHTVYFSTVVLTVYEPTARHLNSIFIVPVTAMPELFKNHTNLLSGSTTYKKLSDSWYDLFSLQLKS